MQRRAAAVYFTLFVVLGAGAYGFLAFSSAPPVQLDGPTYGETDEFTVGGVTYTVNETGDGEGVLTWENRTAGETEAIDVDEGENVSLQGVRHFAHFPEGGGVQVLPTDEFWDDYRADRALRDRYGERRAGVWAVLFMSFLAAVVLLATAYMPIRG